MDTLIYYDENVEKIEEEEKAQRPAGFEPTTS